MKVSFIHVFIAYLKLNTMNRKFIVAVWCAVISFTASAQKKNIKTETFKVYGTCIQCKNRIETALADINVYKANWNIETKMLTVSYDSVKLSKIKISKKLASVGHDTEEFQADENTYNSLPKCCYYQRYKKLMATLPVIDSVKNTTANKIETHTITGVILEEDKKGKLLPLANATVQCLNTNHSATTDSMGVFQLNCSIPIKVAVSYVGFKADTVNITSPSDIKIILKNSSTANPGEVVVKARNQSTYISSFSTFNTLNMGSKELTKAACCNLSESFETSPSVDVQSVPCR